MMNKYDIGLIYSKNVLWSNLHSFIRINLLFWKSYAVQSGEEREKCQQGRVLYKNIQNKSRLLPQNRNVLLNVVPYSEPCSWIHETEKYKRKIFGRYGFSSGIEPYICFSSRQKAGMVDNIEEPYNLHQLKQKIRDKKVLETKAIECREKEIAAKLKKLAQWKEEMTNKVAKKEADALAAKAHKQRLIEEVRRHFGFKVDPKDDRFKEMLEQKEREDKKKQKEAKRKAKEDKMVTKLTNITSIS